MSRVYWEASLNAAQRVVCCGSTQSLFDIGFVTHFAFPPNVEFAIDNVGFLYETSQSKQQYFVGNEEKRFE